MRPLIVSLVLLALAAVPASAQDAAASAADAERAARAVEVVNAIEGHYARTLALLEVEFPDDHAAFLLRIEEIGGAEGPFDTRLLAAFKQFTELRRKHAARLIFAPSLSHSIMLGRLADFYDRVLDAEGTSVCGRFALDGSAVLFELGLSERYADALDQQSLAYFEAVVEAIEAPVYNAPAGPEDWNALFATMLAAGFPESYVQSIAGGRPNDPDLCPALAAMFRTSGLLDTREGERTRADFASNLAGY